MLKLKPFQTEALDALARPGHTICIAPTGAGKSLIYEKLAQKPGFRLLLVSPLIALARQQRERLEALGVRTWLLAGPSTEVPSDRFESGVWICGPESLLSSSRQRILERWRPHAMVVDECHCLWEWGDDFRPAFERLPELIAQARIGRSVWLTATLPAGARRELLKRLPPGTRLIGRFDLPENLSLRVKRVPLARRSDALVEWACSQKESGIVFAPTRETSERLARLLSASSGGTRAAIPYHAGMSAEERRAAENRIATGEPVIVVATSAFGMGMNHPHLRWAVLWQAPLSLLALAQAVGRVGRDARERGTAIVFWDTDDFRTLEWAIGKSEKRRMEFLPTLEFLQAQRCRRQSLRRHFEPDAPPGERCGRCDFCEAAGVFSGRALGCAAG